jgi:iron(III) transport system substrate-binding protein
MVLPDQKGMGTLPVPTTIAVVKGAKNREAAGKLIDYLISIEVENKLIEAKFAGWSVRADVEGEIKAMDVDYSQVARIMPKAVRRATAILEGRE